MQMDDRYVRTNFLDPRLDEDARSTSHFVRTPFDQCSELQHRLEEPDIARGLVHK